MSTRPVWASQTTGHPMWRCKSFQIWKSREQGSIQIGFHLTNVNSENDPRKITDVKAFNSSLHSASYQCLKLSQKSCRSSCLAFQIIRYEEKSTKSSRPSSKVVGLGQADLCEFPTTPHICVSESVEHWFR